MNFVDILRKHTRGIEVDEGECEKVRDVWGDEAGRVKKPIRHGCSRILNKNRLGTTTDTFHPLLPKWIRRART